MIYTMTLNPAVDKTIELKQLEAGSLNKVQRCITSPGGKGINVSMTLKALGMDSVALGLAGGETGNWILKALDQAGIPNRFVQIPEETRTNYKIMEQNGTLTELNMSGVPVSRTAVLQLLELLEQRVVPGDLVILSGSVPPGVPADIYRTMTELVHRQGGLVFLDADGELLRQGIQAKPELIKPNREEALRLLEAGARDLENRQAGTGGEQLTGEPFADEPFTGEPHITKALLAAGASLTQTGIACVLLSDGSRGAYLFEKSQKESCLYAPALPVTPRSVVGAGDSMLAAWAYCMEKGLSAKETFRYALAVSAATVETEGTTPADREAVERLLPMVSTKRLPLC